MNEANRLNKITNEVVKILQETSNENTKKAVKYFTKDLESIAKTGRYEKKTTCLVRRNFTGKYFCQTENDGNGFEITDINSVIKEIEAMGFKVEFKPLTKGYCPFNISWRE